MNNLLVILPLVFVLVVIGLKCLVMGIQTLMVKPEAKIKNAPHAINHLGDN